MNQRAEDHDSRGWRLTVVGGAFSKKCKVSSVEGRVYRAECQV